MYSLSYQKVNFFQFKLFFRRIVVGGINRCIMLISRRKKSLQYRFINNVNDIVDAENQLFELVKTKVNFENF